MRLRVNVRRDPVNTLLAVAQVSERDAFRKSSAKHDHDLVLHVNALISVYVLTLNDPALTDEDERRAACACDRLSQHVLAVVEGLSINLKARVCPIELEALQG